MKDRKSLFITTTQYKNLLPECLVMAKSFFSEYDWESTLDAIKADVMINVVENHFFVRVFENQEVDYSTNLIGFEGLVLNGAIRKALYLECSKVADKKLPWGLLQGIRPTKLVFKIKEQLEGENHSADKEQHKTIVDYQDEIKGILMSRYMVSETMSRLAIKVAIHEEPYIPASIQEAVNSFSMYIGIPFCPTRCHYCSFPSTSLDLWNGHIEDYLDALFHELSTVVPLILSKKSISTIYIGGGTPTSLTASELEKLLSLLHDIIPMHQVKELTVEAGRPDTITREKLEILKKYGVDRISINPQSLRQGTLDIIGRRHSIEEFYKAYQLAGEVGFKRINMDLILGLPDENLAIIKETLSIVKELNPSEITVHTLAIKRSSKIHEEMEKYHLPSDEETNDMLKATREALTIDGNYEPYYLYRQKNMVGSHENVGYYRDDEPCIYNIEIMEEVRPIVAFGAGGVSKILHLDHRLTRTENVKNVTAYIERTDEMIQRKIKEFEL